MEQLVNQSISRYKLVALLGEGGMGAVFKAFDVTLQRDVAIKVMHPHFARQTNFQERFLQEARTAARLNHSCIVQVYDFGQERGRLYIVMKFIAGQNLEKLLDTLRQKKEVLPLVEAGALVVQVSQALDYAHHMGVLHRDIKPANIMIEPDTTTPHAYRPVLTDLGLAKLAEGGVMTQDGTSMGTPAYMSPEQALGQKTDPRSDVYSLGVLLFELMTGRQPFPASSLTEAIRYHTQVAPPKPSSLRSDLPEAIEQVILKSMEKAPANRFQTAGELATALDRATTNLPAPGLATVAGHTDAATAVSAPEPQPGRLATIFAESAPEARGVSMFDHSPAPGESRQDRIQLIGKDKSSRLISVTKAELTLGREEDNDIVLNDTQASRHHARIEFAQDVVRVVDLNSTNGTFLGGVRLLPGISEEWTPDKPLLIGGSAMRLLRGGVGVDDSHTEVHRRDQPFVAQGTMGVPAGASLSGAGDSRIGLQVESPALTLTPGQSTSLVVSLFNQGSVVDHFRLELEGVSPRWVTSQPGTIQLMPGARQSLTLSIQPPRTPEARAGRYPLVVRVTSQDNPNQMAEARLTMTVAPYSQFSAEIYPQRLKAGRDGRLTVTNNGNSQETFAVSFSDRADELSFRPPNQQIRVNEGQKTTANFSARPHQMRLFGGEKQHPFTVRISLPQGEIQTQSGELVSRALIPPWVIPLVLLLGMLLLAGAGVAFSAIQTQYRQATQTVDGANTQVAEIVAGTARALTQQVLDAEATGEAGMSTAQAAANTQMALTEQSAVQGTADAVKATNDALVAALTQNALDAINAQNAQTSTAMAGQMSTLQAQQTIEAEQAIMALTLTKEAEMTMTAQAAQAMTAGAEADLAKEMNFFVGNWYNPSPVDNQLTRLEVAKIDDATLSFHGYNKCNPDDCDLGTNDKVAFTLPTVSGVVNGNTKGVFLLFSRTIRATKNANGIDLDVEVETYSFITRTSTTYYYTFKREFRFIPFILP